MAQLDKASLARLCGAMVARLTPDQKVACSIHVRVTFSLLLYNENMVVGNGHMVIVEKVQVLPRFELGSLDSKSRVLTITP